MRPNSMSKKAKKLKKGDEVTVLGRFGRVTKVHSKNPENVTVHFKTFTSANPQRFTIILDRNAHINYRPKPKKK